MAAMAATVPTPLRSEDVASLQTWIEKKMEKYTAPDMQNEIIKLMALEVLRQIVISVKTAPFMITL